MFDKCWRRKRRIIRGSVITKCRFMPKNSRTRLATNCCPEYTNPSQVMEQIFRRSENWVTMSTSKGLKRWFSFVNFADMLEQCSFCVEGDTTIRAGKKHVAVRQYRKNQSIKMILGEIKTSCNLFEISPIYSETQQYLQYFSSEFFSYFTHHHNGIFPSSRNKRVNWALKSTLGTTGG